MELLGEVAFSLGWSVFFFIQYTGRLYLLAEARFKQKNRKPKQELTRNDPCDYPVTRNLKTEKNVVVIDPREPTKTEFHFMYRRIVGVPRFLDGVLQDNQIRAASGDEHPLPQVNSSRES